MGRIIVMLAGLLAAAPAFALDRAPVPSEGRLEPCPSQGAGFARIPGTSTCIRLSGRVSAGFDTGAVTRAPVQGRFSIDTRSESDLGPMRSYMRIDAGR